MANGEAMTNPLVRPLDLPCGATLSNRLAKAATSEGLADSGNHSTPRLEALYRRWAGSGAGLLLSGNIQVDRWHLERPNNVVIDDDSGRVQLGRLAEAGTSQGAHFWAQLSHTGRQVSSHINSAPLSSSDVEIDVIRNAGFSFAKPKPMTEAEIGHAIDEFASAARKVKDAGFCRATIKVSLRIQIVALQKLSRKNAHGRALPRDNHARGAAADFDCRTANPATRQRWLERLHYSIRLIDTWHERDHQSFIHWAAPELIPGERLRYTDKFDDPNLPGDIRVTVALKKVSVGTELDIVQEVLPDVIPPEACYLGYQESPRNLARLVEPKISHSPPRHAWPGAHPCLHRPRSRSCG
jgi:hypothetical protein